MAHKKYSYPLANRYAGRKRKRVGYSRMIARSYPYAPPAPALVGYNKAEMKLHQINYSGTSTGTWQYMNSDLLAIPQNDTESGREGREVTLRYLKLKARIAFIPGRSAGFESITLVAYYHIYLIQDKQCNGAQPTIFNANEGIFDDAAHPLAEPVMANKARFKFLKHWKIPLRSVGYRQSWVATSVEDLKEIEWGSKCNIKIQYDTSAATGALVTRRSNNLLLIGTTEGLTTDEIDFYGNVATYFTEN